MEFRRIGALPPYVFAVTDKLKLDLRRAGEDVIDLGFGNPDIPSPEVAVAKLQEAAGKERNHRYSASRGIPKLRAGDLRPLPAPFAVELDPETEAITTIGAKEGLSHLMWVLLQPGDSAVVPSPSYPIHIYAPVLAGADVNRVAMGPGEDLFGNLVEAFERSWPRPRVIILSFPHNPTTATVDLEFMQRAVDFAREHEVLIVHDFAYADLGFDGYRATVDPPGRGREGGRRRALHADEVVLDGGLARRVPGRARRCRAGPRPAQVLPRLRHLPADPDRVDRRHERGAGLPGAGRTPSTARGATRSATASPGSAGSSPSRGRRCSSGRRSPSPTASSARSTSR